MNLTRRQTLVGLAAATMLPARSAFAQQKTLIVPTLGGVWEQFWRDKIAPEFASESGANVTLDVGNGRVFGANLRAAGVQNPPYSIVMTNEVFSEGLRKEGFFEELDLSKLPNYEATYPVARNTGGYGVVACYSPIGIGYRTDMVRTPPTKWKDLWDNPEFQGKIGLYNFANSAGKMELLLASMLYGKDQYDVDAGFKALADLGQVIQVDFNLSTALAAGEIVVAPFDFAEIARLKKQGLPVDYVVPEEGVLAFDQTLNILANGPEKELAYQYANFILSAEMQELLMREFYVSPTNTAVTVPEDLAYEVPISGDRMSDILQWDWAFVNENQNELSERWASTVG
ncbi:ABC transporter substrate-binding protein [Mesorhizobium microcysteis]|uniref:ABC transporter substrate-binding protein n=1 Tax=Neoaquamicrobium microcysteis TaxID=2682781 RepID=A0A5D4GZG9_9HYPH|nr:ABC transporter substrate-binding protein [Mesorhizobium microcysteis]TYR33219.1 ABC transporter substrate-binding protein [Mesorhizobium microcysteis]